MKKFLFVILLLALVVTGCATVDSNSNTPPTPVPVKANTKQPAATTAQGEPTILPLAPSKCQSKVTGRVVDAKGGLVKGATVGIKGGSFTAKTLSDENGLYGFAGLCAGSFSFTVQPPSQAAKTVAGNVTVDGNNSAKADLTYK